jgi:hypothetical protein
VVAVSCEHVHKDKGSGKNYAPIKVNRVYKVNDKLELRSGYVNGQLMLQISYNRHLGSNSFSNSISLTSDEYFILRQKYDNVQCGLKSNLSLNTHLGGRVYISSNSADSEMCFSRDGYNMLSLPKSEFENLGNPLLAFWGIFKHSPIVPNVYGNNAVTPYGANVMEAIYMQGAAQMIDLICGIYPQVNDFSVKAMGDVRYREVFNIAYAKMMNFGIFHIIVAQLKIEFPEFGKKVDPFLTVVQALNDLNVLAHYIEQIAMN